MPAPWTEVEDQHLCIAYINVSEDSSVGTDQNSSKLWNRIYEKFEALRNEQKLPKTRDKSANLQNRWASKIKPEVALFANLTHQVLVCHNVKLMVLIDLVYR